MWATRWYGIALLCVPVQLLVNSMLASLPQLGNVLFLCAFLFVLFGIIGVQIFGGRMDQRCVVPTSDSTFYFPSSEEGFVRAHALAVAIEAIKGALVAVALLVVLAVRVH